MAVRNNKKQFFGHPNSWTRQFKLLTYLCLNNNQTKIVYSGAFYGKTTFLNIFRKQFPGNVKFCCINGRENWNPQAVMHKVAEEFGLRWSKKKDFSDDSERRIVVIDHVEDVSLDVLDTLYKTIEFANISNDKMQLVLVSRSGFLDTINSNDNYKFLRGESYLLSLDCLDQEDSVSFLSNLANSETLSVVNNKNCRKKTISQKIYRSSKQISSSIGSFWYLFPLFLLAFAIWLFEFGYNFYAEYDVSSSSQIEDVFVEDINSANVYDKVEVSSNLQQHIIDYQNLVNSNLEKSKDYNQLINSDKLVDMSYDINKINKDREYLLGLPSSSSFVQLVAFRDVDKLFEFCNIYNVSSEDVCFVKKYSKQGFWYALVIAGVGSEEAVNIANNYSKILPTNPWVGSMKVLKLDLLDM